MEIIHTFYHWSLGDYYDYEYEDYDSDYEDSIYDTDDKKTPEKSEEYYDEYEDYITEDTYDRKSSSNDNHLPGDDEDYEYDEKGSVSRLIFIRVFLIL